MQGRAPLLRIHAAGIQRWADARAVRAAEQGFL